MPDIAPHAPRAPGAPASADAAHIAAIVAARQHLPGALLPILHEIQDTQGFIPDTAVPVIARALNLSRAEVHGVITFYHHFRQQPAGRHVVQVCRAEACQAVGAEALAEHAQRALGCGFHETSADGQVTLEPVYCLGQCACGPAVMVGEQLHGYVDAARFDALVRALRPSSTPSTPAEAEAQA
ncbi:NAD-dependent formate dehydrogenase gamma subunit [Cupriavidus taiwanensis]|uniref:NAD-dependent formate dehydrogenase gamma subunit n=1 Tax=Cupriavidus taiwanensis TaxID=164546 RepID=A0A976AZ24_9BURK|nr:formate dehydrogenase subunit gamma [Cupriavidus taiwanensis]SOZ60831.1 NAD-dependent formate dehydrogenase gamma subunit [Cupriavidus taiwanensis]SOZ61010.1 NAD-dependent formate dehydrogenase gamma subunit [Cupriavidus taiwanensis]SOZ64925.1 NAD-dependent formate dehydrogenase gamma subunit [Cupriavidus taiwanensis]SPA06875.1 NAD-dependent formate dehydrogenase gamma subunit [Cupriavidus taiwanensis]